MSDEQNKPEPSGVTLKEAILALSEMVAEQLSAVAGGISVTTAKAKMTDGSHESGIAMVVAVGKAQSELVARHYEAMKKDAESEGLVDQTESNTEAAQKAIERIVPHEDAKGCSRHKTFGACEEEYKDLIRRCWEPIYQEMEKAGVSFSGVKDKKNLRHIFRKAVTTGLVLGLRMAKDGCQGYKGSRYRP